MDAWIIWLLVAVAFAGGEVATMGFFLAPFAGGALVAAVLAALGVVGVAPWLAFLGASLLLLLLVRPIARSHLHMPPELRTGSAALVGKEAIVLERISNDASSGCVKIDGEIWTARAYNPDQMIEIGEHVQVLEIRGAIALVVG